MSLTVEQYERKRAATARADAIEDAIVLLRKARAILRREKCPKSGDAVARAIKSTDGARRNAIGKGYRL